MFECALFKKCVLNMLWGPICRYFCLLGSCVYRGRELGHSMDEIWKEEGTEEREIQRKGKEHSSNILNNNRVERLCYLCCEIFSPPTCVGFKI